MGLEWWKKLGFFFLCAAAGLVFLPCLIPCLIRLFTSVVQGMSKVTISRDKKVVGPDRGKKMMILKENSEIEDISPEAKLIYERYERINETGNSYESQMLHRRER